MKIVPRHPIGLRPGRSRRASAPTMIPAIRYSIGPIRSPRCESPPDHVPLDLVRALDDLEALGLAHVALDRVLFYVPVPAVDLNRVRRDPHRGVGAEHLGLGGLDGIRLTRVPQRGGMPV